jgi:hypothetical protein
MLLLLLLLLLGHFPRFFLVVDVVETRYLF